MKTGVLLVNLGSPDAPTPAAVRRYLREFLSDPRVVEMPRCLWLPLLYALVLPLRARRSAAKYALIWGNDAPLREHTQDQARLLQAELDARHINARVFAAMRYGKPAIGKTLDAMQAAGVTRVMLLPLYPQYAASTTASTLDAVCAWLVRCRNQPEIHSVRSFCAHPGYIAALEANVRQHWQTHGAPDDKTRLVLSFHGLPEKSRALGDPYHDECQKTGYCSPGHCNWKAGNTAFVFNPVLAAPPGCNPIPSLPCNSSPNPASGASTSSAPALWRTAWRRWKKSPWPPNPAF